MGVPRKHHTKSKVGRRRSHQAKKPLPLTVCPNCQAPRLSHRICPYCRQLVPLGNRPKQ